MWLKILYIRVVDNTDPEASYVDAVRKHEPASTQEVADECDVSRPTASSHLKILAAGGRIKQKKIANVLVWSLPRDRPDDETD